MNIIIYTVSALKAYMAAYIIFLSAGTRRVFSVEIFLSMQCLLFPVHRLFVRPCFVGVVFVACCLVGID